MGQAISLAISQYRSKVSIWNQKEYIHKFDAQNLTKSAIRSVVRRFECCFDISFIQDEFIVYLTRNSQYAFVPE